MKPVESRPGAKVAASPMDLIVGASYPRVDGEPSLSIPVPREMQRGFGVSRPYGRLSVLSLELPFPEYSITVCPPSEESLTSDPPSC